MCADRCIYVLVLYKRSLREFVFTGPLCGKLDAAGKNVTFNSNEVIIMFKSGPHRSGRGFLLSYATDQHPGTPIIYAF